MAWRLAKSLLTLREQINAAAPRRSRASDGSIGNAEHATRDSDHNPWLPGEVVSAIDITHDPAGGMDTDVLAAALIASHDPRIKYIIRNRRILSSTVSPWQWRPYSGANPHDKHMHISVQTDPAKYDSVALWAIGTHAPSGAPAPIERPTLRKGASGELVAQVQRALGVVGDFGPATEFAVKKFQANHKLHVDGVIGPYTWDKLEEFLK